MQLLGILIVVFDYVAPRDADGVLAEFDQVVDVDVALGHFVLGADRVLHFAWQLREVDGRLVCEASLRSQASENEVIPVE